MWQISVAADTTRLEIDEVFPEDCGDYCVVASSSAGEARTACHVHVIALPPSLQPAQTAAAAADDDDDDGRGGVSELPASRQSPKFSSQTEQQVASIHLNALAGLSSNSLIC